MTKNIKPKHIKKFETLARKLDELMKEITEYNPDANIYVEDSWNFNLMKGPTHNDDINQSALQDNVVSCISVYTASGGGW